MRKINVYLTSIITAFCSFNSYTQNIKYDKSEYLKQCMKIINESREEFHLKLPYIIKSNINIIKDDIDSKKKEKTSSVSKKEYLKIKEEINFRTFIRLLENEKKANEIYTNTLVRLSEINSIFFNHYYDNKKTLMFKDFYDLPNIRLAEEVTLYLEEIIKLEEERVARDNKDLIASSCLSVLELIPGATAVTKILEGVKLGAKAVRTASKLEKNASISAKITNRLIGNKDRALSIIRKISNAEKRAKISARIAYVGGTATLSQLALTSKLVNESNANIDEKINEFAKGMTAVYLQNLRDYIKVNREIIP